MCLPENAAQEGTAMTREHTDVTGPVTNHSPAACQKVAPILARVGDKWSVLIVIILAGGTCRFNELKRRVEGISQRMLTLTLRGLERDGLVTRTAYPTIPPRVEYGLTDLGRSLCGPVSALGGWAQENGDAMAAARLAFDERERTSRA
jgi:DNA-binding HxlR family transcriptional regulator